MCVVSHALAAVRVSFEGRVGPTQLDASRGEQSAFVVPIVCECARKEERFSAAREKERERKKERKRKKEKERGA